MNNDVGFFLSYNFFSHLYSGERGKTTQSKTKFNHKMSLEATFHKSLLTDKNQAVCDDYHFSRSCTRRSFSVFMKRVNIYPSVFKILYDSL